MKSSPAQLPPRSSPVLLLLTSLPSQAAGVSVDFLLTEMSLACVSEEEEEEEAKARGWC